MHFRISSLLTTLSLIVALTTLTPIAAHAAAIVLHQPVPLQQESIAALRHSLQPQDQDHWKLVFFGFAHCKEICPVSMAKLSMLIKAAAKAQVKVNGIFVTVDPDRDTDTVLSSYAKSFGAHLSHLRLEGEQLERFKTSFGVEALFYTKNAGNTQHYQVDHSTTAFLIDPHGNIRILFDALDDATTLAKMFDEDKDLFKL